MKKSNPQFISIALCAVIAFAVCSSAAGADGTIWSAGSDSWFTCSNWSNGCPTTSLDAFVNNSGKAQIASEGATARSVTLGQNGGTKGEFDVDGGTLVIPPPAETTSGPYPTLGVVYVGYEDTGTVNVREGGSVSSWDVYISPAASSLLNSNGTVTINGTGSTWTVAADGLAQVFVGVQTDNNGNGGTALLTVSDGGMLSVANLPSGGPVAAVLVGTSGTLTGNGTIDTSNSSAGGNFTAIRGTIAPNWTLSVLSNLELLGTATTQCDVTPSNLGSVDTYVSGSASLAGRLSVKMTGSFTPGTQFTLLHADGGIGTTQFDSYSIRSSGTGFTPTITYDSNNVYLYLVPN